MEFRDAGEVTAPAEGILTGYAAVFGNVYDGDRGPERIMPGALTVDPSAFLEVDHSPTPYARLGHTLTVNLDAHGLEVRAQLDMDDGPSQSLWRKVARRDYKGMSLGMVVHRDRLVNGIREILAATVYQLSVVSRPANLLTTVTVRSAPTKGNPMTTALQALQARRAATVLEHATVIDEIAAATTDTTELETRASTIAGAVERLDGLIGSTQAMETRGAAAAAAAVAVAPVVLPPARPGGAPIVQLGAQPLTYRADSQHSYFLDLGRASILQDPSAQERLARHALEMRDLNRTDGTGGHFVPPVHLMSDLATMLRAGRITADRMTNRPLPGGTDSLNIPRITTGSATAIQTADNTSVAETDIVDATIAVPVRTIAGQQDAAIQLIEQSPIGLDSLIFDDLLADVALRTNLQVINGSGAAGQVLGILGTAGIAAVAYTDATPTVSEFYAKLADAIQRINTLRLRGANLVIMHPRRWAWISAALDTAGRPLVVPTNQGPMNALAATGPNVAEGLAGYIQGLPVYVDPSIPTNLGAGVNEDIMIVGRGEDGLLYESTPRTRVLPDVGSGTLTVRFQVYTFVAFTAARYPAAWATIGGTGLIAPTF